MTKFDKDPSAILDYTVDWSNWLDTAETITSSTWTADTGLTIVSSSRTSNKSTVFLSGGTGGENYLVSNTIVTSASPTRTDRRTIKIAVKTRPA